MKQMYTITVPQKTAKSSIAENTLNDIILYCMSNHIKWWESSEDGNELYFILGTK